MNEQEGLSGAEIYRTFHNDSLAVGAGPAFDEARRSVREVPSVPVRPGWWDNLRSAEGRSFEDRLNQINVANEFNVAVMERYEQESRRGVGGVAAGAGAGGGARQAGDLFGEVGSGRHAESVPGSERDLPLTGSGRHGESSPGSWPARAAAVEVPRDALPPGGGPAGMRQTGSAEVPRTPSLAVDKAGAGRPPHVPGAGVVRNPADAPGQARSDSVEVARSAPPPGRGQAAPLGPAHPPQRPTPPRGAVVAGSSEVSQQASMRGAVGSGLNDAPQQVSSRGAVVAGPSQPSQQAPSRGASAAGSNQLPPQASMRGAVGSGPNDASQQAPSRGASAAGPSQPPQQVSSRGAAVAGSNQPPQQAPSRGASAAGSTQLPPQVPMRGAAATRPNDAPQQVSSRGPVVAGSNQPPQQAPSRSTPAASPNQPPRHLPPTGRNQPPRRPSTPPPPTFGPSALDGSFGPQGSGGFGPTSSPGLTALGPVEPAAPEPPPTPANLSTGFNQHNPDSDKRPSFLLEPEHHENFGSDALSAPPVIGE